MGAHDLGPWAPISVTDAVELFRPAGLRWWLCRPTPDSPWMIDVTIGDGNEHDWIYRRDPTIRRSWVDAVLTTPNATPYLVPELQLLFKSKHVRPKDDLDAATVIPLVGDDRRSWLANHLPLEHRWQTTIAGTRARLAIDSNPDEGIELFAAGRSPQAWRASRSGGEWVQEAAGVGGLPRTGEGEAVSSPNDARRVRMDPDERREQILRVAARLFGQRPYSEVSVSDIAGEAGIARGLLHHYFGSKRELYLEVVRMAGPGPARRRARGPGYGPGVDHPGRQLPRCHRAQPRPLAELGECRGRRT